jgi:hypothetical protein
MVLSLYVCVGDANLHVPKVPPLGAFTAVEAAVGDAG